MALSVEAAPAPEAARRLERTTWLIFLAIIVPTAATSLAVAVFALPAALVFVFPLLFFAAWVLHAPVRGLYVLFAAALLIPVQPLLFQDSTLDRIPFFLNLSDPMSLNLPGLGITPAEILMLLVLMGWIAHLALTREQMTTGRLLAPYLIYAVAILIGELNGLVRGGDFKLSLWELRPQVYGLATFLMATFLLKQRSQLKVLLVLVLICELVKGVISLYRYYVTFGRDVGPFEAVQSHEESYLMALFLVIVVIGILWYRRPLVVLLTVLAPITFIAIVVNHRRIGIVALGVEIATVAVIAFMTEPRLRRGLLVAGGVSAVAGAVFVAAFWNQQYGAVAELIRPVKSLVDPSVRDLASNLYRAAETANLKATYRTSPLLGIGFGHPYYIFYPQTGVESIDPLWNIIPHNSLLWVPMRMGVFGLITFWGLIGTAVAEAIWAIRKVHDTFIRLAVVFALATIFGELVSAYVDVDLENYRNLIFMGLMLGLINRAPSLARDWKASEVTEPPREP